MDYQLVLQFHGASLRIFEQLKDLENNLEPLLGASESFDGLDSGGHGANLFLYTDDPGRTFETVRPLLHQAESETGFTAAYRTVAKEHFRILWPADAAAGFSLR